jgi:Family of unknown function (DUF6328)
VPEKEGKDERLDRELIELLNELRVVLPGVQVLFAFLLTVPFTQRFDDATSLQRDVYFMTFLAAAVSTALLIAPSAYHRLNWRQGDKEHLLVVSNRMAIAGTVFLALAIVGTVFVVTDVIFEALSAALLAGGTTAFFGWLWYGMPLIRRLRDD